MRWLRLATTALCVLLAVSPATTAQEPSPLPSPDGISLDPNNERPLTQDELLVVRGERKQNSDWGNVILVADAIIDRDTPIRGKAPDTGGGLAIGSLGRRGEHPGDPVVTARKQLKASYPADQTPIAGLLAIEVRREELRLHGSVETPTGAYLTPIEPGAMAEADELPAGALIAAHGWLSRLAPEGMCPDVPKALDRQDADGRGSPFVRCPGGWLTANEVTEVDPADPLSPASFGIPVQHGAVERFTEGLPERIVPTPATYLLRHVAHPIAGAEPALGWEVMGRLDPVPSGVLTAAPPETVTLPGGLDWQPGLERQPPVDGWWLHTTAWDGGFASVRIGRDRVLSSWVSPDGRTWQSAELPRGIRSVSALLRLGDGLVIIADESPPYGDWRFETWTSDDGLTWRQAGRQHVTAPREFESATESDGYRRIVQGYWSLGDRIVALETYTAQRCCGRAPGWTVVANRGHQPDVTFAWSSRDGRRWQRQRARGIPKVTREYFGHLVAEGDGELLVLWGGEGRPVGRTTDGVRWMDVGHVPPEHDGYSPTVLTRTPDGFVLGGSVEGRREDRWQDMFVLWRSMDGESWEQTYERLDGRPESITSAGDTVILAGNDLDPRFPDIDPPPNLPWLLVSEDGGETWDASLAWKGDTDWCLRSLTANGATVVLDTACAPPDAASTYAVAVEIPEA